MKKTKTITFHAVYNYGAVLQAYSLQQFLLENKTENELIDMRDEHSIGRKGVFEKKLSVKNVLHNFIRLLHLPWILRYRKRMKAFVSKMLHVTRLYNSIEDLCTDPPSADAYICGSDQIWNVHNVIRKDFFLDFGGDAQKIAYAPSFGIDYLDDYQEKYIKSALASFDAISAREQSGVTLLKNMGFENAVQCIDPVFLHTKEYWDKLCAGYTSVTPKEKYILVYSLSYDPVLDRTLEALKRKTGYAVYAVTPNGYTRIKGCKKIISAGPLEFLNLISNAQYVVASSFHGVAFSIIFEKNFYAYANLLTGTRVINILEQAGLSDRRIDSNTGVPDFADIDYDSSRPMLERAVNESKKYLSEALYE